MAPTLRDGQLIWTRALRRNDRIRRGDLVAIDSVEVGRRFIKRVVGLPGERVEFRAGACFIDGAPLDEPYASACRFNGSFDVPDGHYLLLGDNRSASIDSRSWTVPYVRRDQMVGRLRAVGPRSRWSRLMSEWLRVSCAEP